MVDLLQGFVAKKIPPGMILEDGELFPSVLV